MKNIIHKFEFLFIVLLGASIIIGLSYLIITEDVPWCKQIEKCTDLDFVKNPGGKTVLGIAIFFMTCITLQGIKDEIDSMKSKRKLDEYIKQNPWLDSR